MSEVGDDFTVDLSAQKVISPDGTEWPFAIQALLRKTLLEGLDQITVTLKQSDAIRAWEKAEQTLRPWTMVPGLTM